MPNERASDVVGPGVRAYLSAAEGERESALHILVPLVFRDGARYLARLGYGPCEDEIANGALKLIRRIQAGAEVRDWQKYYHAILHNEVRGARRTRPPEVSLESLVDEDPEVLEPVDQIDSPLQAAMRTDDANAILDGVERTLKRGTNAFVVVCCDLIYSAGSGRHQSAPNHMVRFMLGGREDNISTIRTRAMRRLYESALLSRLLEES